jgi:hypothetical protein
MTAEDGVAVVAVVENRQPKTLLIKVTKDEVKNNSMYQPNYCSAKP